MLSRVFLHNSNFSSTLLPEAYSTSTFGIVLSTSITFPFLSRLFCACIDSSMFSFQGAVCTKIDVDGCKNAIETPQQALLLQYLVDFCIGKCVTDLPQLEFDVILVLVQGTV